MSRPNKRTWLVYCSSCGEAEARYTREEARKTRKLYLVGHGPNNVKFGRIQ